MKSIKLKVVARKTYASEQLTLAKFISTDADHQINAMRIITGWLEGHPNGRVEIVVDPEELVKINQVMKSTRNNAAQAHCNEIVDNEHFGAFTSIA